MWFFWNIPTVLYFGTTRNRRGVLNQSPPIRGKLIEQRLNKYKCKLAIFFITCTSTVFI